jgi:DNA-binding CsgD family transcriptional regulator
MKENHTYRERQPKVRPKDLEDEIVKLAKAGLGLTAIARKLGISRGSAYGILVKARAKGVVRH